MFSRKKSKKIVNQILKDLDEGTYDRLEELIFDIDDALEMIPIEFKDIRKKLEVKLDWATEELRKIHMED